ncbi:MAG: TonB-dependent receptor plug domain-containing protein [Flavisolibacter sp.]
MRRPILTTVLLLCLHFLFAQEKESELDPVTVTTSIAPEKASRTGRNVLVIKGEHFASLPVHSVDELLRYLPGIEVQSRGPMGAQSDIVLRGGTFQQVLIILDGIRLNDPNTGHFTAYIPIAPTEIERIEILKGASSAIYGSEAVGGVIQIITKSFASKKMKLPSTAMAQITGGQYGLFNVNAGGFYSNGKTSVGGGLLTNNADGQQQRGIRGYVHAHTGSLSLSQKLGERWDLSVRSAYDSRDFAAQNFYTNFISDTASEKVQTFWNQLALAHHGNKHEVALHLGYKNLVDQYSFSPVYSPNHSTSKLTQALLTDEWKLNEKSTLTSGAQFISKRIISNDRGDHRVDQAAGFAILNQQLGQKFFFSPALRLEWIERSGWELVPQVNLSYRDENLQLRGSAGKTIRDADFTERFNNYQKTFVGNGSIGNPDLEPERSFSYEAGADYFLNHVKLSGTFFQRLHSMLIDWVNTPYADMPRKDNLSPTGNYALAKNISKVNTLGVETDLQYSKKIEDHQEVWLVLGLTWMQSTSSEATPSFYISSHAHFLANFSFNYRIQRLSIAVNGLYKNREEQKATANIAPVTADYFVLNAKTEFEVWKNKGSIFVEADNLLDTNYTDLLGAQMPGFWLMGGIKISLSKQ